jgi:hypothetical protein
MTHRKDDDRHGNFDNRDQDPGHPANTTQPSTDPGQPRPRAEQFNVPPEDLLTEQEKDVVGTGGTDVTAGVGPVAPSEHTSGPVETIEDQGIGPRTPYPTGNPPPVGEITTRSQAVKGVTDQKGESPSESRGTSGTTRRENVRDNHEGDKRR